VVPEDYTFYTDLLDLVAKGEVPMSRIDDAVSRI
jgi:beta-glucosidase